MKEATKKVLIALGLFASLLSYANGSPEDSKEKESKVTTVNFDNVKLGSMLSIKDMKGLVIYKEPISKPGNYSKGFDLTSLPNGDYFFELDTEMEIVIIPFNIVSNQVEFRKEEKTKIYKPSIRVKDDMVFVSRISFDASPMECKIYYADNNDLVRTEKFSNEKYVKKIYDFSASEEGEYIFVFETDGRKFTKSIKI
jgi:hypothetical protein